MRDDHNPCALHAFLDRVALEAYDRQGQPEPEPRRTVQPESRIIVAGRGIRRDNAA
jgi:hypothetical protein